MPGYRMHPTRDVVAQMTDQPEQACPYWAYATGDGHYDTVYATKEAHTEFSVSPLDAPRITERLDALERKAAAADGLDSAVEKLLALIDAGDLISPKPGFPEGVVIYARNARKALNPSQAAQAASEGR